MLLLLFVQRQALERIRRLRTGCRPSRRCSCCLLLLLLSVGALLLPVQQPQRQRVVCLLWCHRPAHDSSRQWSAAGSSHKCKCANAGTMHPHMAATDACTLRSPCSSCHAWEHSGASTHRALGLPLATTATNRSLPKPSERDWQLPECFFETRLHAAGRAQQVRTAAAAGGVLDAAEGA